MPYGPTLTPLDFGGVTALDPDDASLPAPDLWLRAGSGIEGTGNTTARLFTYTDKDRFERASNAAFSFGGSDFTIAAWVYLTNKTPNDAHIVTKFNTDPANEYILRWNKSADRFIWHISEDGTTTTALNHDTLGAPSTGTWYFLVAEHVDGATMSLLINDSSNESQAYTNGIVAETSSEFQIGMRQDTTNQGSSCRIAKVGMWARTLTPAEKTWLYNSGEGRWYGELGQSGDGSDLLTSLRVYYNLNESSGDAIDAHTSGLDLTDTATVQSAAGNGTTPPPPANGEAVSSWTSIDSNAHEFAQATGAKQPLYTTNAIKTRPGITFDGTDDLLSVADTINTATEGTVFIVFKITPGGIGDQTFLSSADEGTTDHNWKIGIAYSDTIGKYGVSLGQNNTSGDATLVADGNTDVFAGVELIATVASNGTATTMRIRGRNGTVTDLTSTDNGDWLGDTTLRDNFVLGALKNSSEGEHSAVTIAEVIIYPSKLTTSQEQGVEKGLSTHYGLSLGYATTGVPKMIPQKFMHATPAWTTGVDAGAFAAGYPDYLNLDDIRSDVPGVPAASHMIFYSSDHATSTAWLGYVTFDYPLGTWTDKGSAVSSNDDGEAPQLIPDTANSLVRIYTHEAVSGSQRQIRFTSTDMDSVTTSGNQDTITDLTGQHEGYGPFQLSGTTIWAAHGMTGTSPELRAISSSTNGTAFTVQRVYSMVKNYLLDTGLRKLYPTADFVWRGAQYMWHGSSGDYGSTPWSWSNGRPTGNFKVMFSEDTSADHDISLSWATMNITWATMAVIDSILYCVYAAKDVTGNGAPTVIGNSGFFLAAANMFEAETTEVTPQITVSDGLPVYGDTPNTDTVADWDATAEDIPAAFEVVANSGTDASSWSSGNYYQFEHGSGVAQDIDLQYTSTIDPTAFEVVDFIIEGTTKQNTAIADSPWYIDLRSADELYGVRLDFDNSNKDGILRLYNNGEVATTSSFFGVWDFSQIRAIELDITFRFFDNGTKLVLIMGGVPGAYQDLSSVGWTGGMKPRLTMISQNTFPSAWWRFTRLAITTSAT